MLEMNSKYSIITGIAFVDILSLNHGYHLAVTPCFYNLRATGLFDFNNSAFYGHPRERA